MYVVDASVWVSRFLPSDAHYHPSRSWLGGRIEQGEILASPALLLPEVGGAVARRTGSSELASRIISLLLGLSNLRLVPVEADLTRTSAQLASELRLRGADALYVALARQLAVPLVTWDQEQRQRSGDSVAALTPEAALEHC
ncbi:MAG: type II toxin-antitoxin system VapC family toxin [Dehalococcoidia bacterium]